MDPSESHEVRTHLGNAAELIASSRAALDSAATTGAATSEALAQSREQLQAHDRLPGPRHIVLSIEAAEASEWLRLAAYLQTHSDRAFAEFGRAMQTAVNGQ